MFDFDGVIADSWGAQAPIFVNALRGCGLHEVATSATFLDLLDSNWFEGLSTVGVPDHVIAEMDEAWEAQSHELFPGMPQVIERLAEDHVVLVITSAATEAVRRVLREHEVAGVTEVIGGDVEPSKTSKIRSALERYGETLEPWYICDTVGDVVEARAAGAVVVGAAWGWHGEERLLRSKPDLMARHPHDLLDLL